MIRIVPAAWFLIALAAMGQPASRWIRLYPGPGIVRGIAEGAEGFFWVAGEGGLYRFDGLHFHAEPKYPFRSARSVALTSDGAVWISSGQGLVRHRNDRFDIVSRDDMLIIAALGEDLAVHVSSARLLLIRGDGSTADLEPGIDGHPHMDAESTLWFRKGKGVYRRRRGAARSEQVGGTDRTYRQAIPGRNGTIWMCDKRRVYRLEPLRLAWTREVDGRRSGDLCLAPGSDGQVWFLDDPLRGLDPAVELRIPPSAEGFRRMAFEDSRGHLWVDDKDGLLEIVTDSGWENWPASQLEGQYASRIAREQDGTLIAATHGRGLFRLSGTSRKWEKTGALNEIVYSALPLPDGSLLASLRTKGLAHISHQGTMIQILGNPTARQNNFRDLQRDSTGGLWAADKSNVQRVEGSAGTFTLRHAPLPGEPVPRSGTQKDVMQVGDLEIDTQGRLWAGYLLGLAWMDQRKQWHRAETDRPVTNVQSFTFGGSGEGDEIWVAYKSGSRFSRLRRSGAAWRVEDFTPDGGYPAGDTHFIKRDSRGWIWRGTDQGVHVSDGVHVQPNDWVHLHANNGLGLNVTDQFGFFEDRDGSVWLSGEEGISHVTPRPEWFRPPAGRPPRVTRLRADGLDASFPETLPDTFVAPCRRLRIDLGTFDTAAIRQHPLLYRLHPAFDDWKPAVGGSVDLSDLAPREYRLEVAYAGQPVAAALTYSFRVGEPAWSVPWRWMLSAAGGIAVLAIARRSIWSQRLRYRIAKWRHTMSRSKPTGGNRDPEVFLDRTGNTLSNRYELVKILSQGGFATVYAARDLQESKAPVAVKVLHKRVGEESWVKERFALEVAALNMVDHPGVVRLLEAWLMDEGQACLVTPLLDGPTLRAILSQRPLEPARTVRLIRGIAAALDEVHGRGLVHRDLKPENIIVVGSAGGEEQPVLIDFGNAGLLGNRAGISATRMLGGSVLYMAPEQLTMHYAAGSDVYAFGVIILEMLTGKRLADLSHVAASSGFEEELRHTLAFAGVPNAAELALELADAFLPDPSMRPVLASPWVERLGVLLIPG